MMIDMVMWTIHLQASVNLANASNMLRVPQVSQPWLQPMEQLDGSEVERVVKTSYLFERHSREEC